MYPQFHSLRYQVLQAILEDDIEQLEKCLAAGWPIDKEVDSQDRYSAVSLACHLDKLEVLHCLDLHGADLSRGAGKFNNTPLMNAVGRWNVRIIDYLMVRGADPHVIDRFGFTALKRAQIKNLRSIQAMLSNYELE